MFDTYAEKDNSDLIRTNGAIKYLEDIHVQPDHIGCLIVCELLDSPTIGEFTRKGFVKGWLLSGYEKESLIIPPRFPATDVYF